MTWESATDALLQHFRTRWTALNPSVPIAYPNGRPLSPNVETEPWVRLTFVPSFAQRTAVGGQLREQGGRVVVSTFTPLRSGDGNALAYDRQVESIFETAHANGLDGSIHLGAPEPIPGGADPDIPMYRTGISVPFRFDHTP